MNQVVDLVKQLKFEGYTDEEIVEMVKECLKMEFEY